MYVIHGPLCALSTRDTRLIGNPSKTLYPLTYLSTDPQVNRNSQLLARDIGSPFHTVNTRFD